MLKIQKQNSIKWPDSFLLWHLQTKNPWFKNPDPLLIASEECNKETPKQQKHAEKTKIDTCRCKKKIQDLWEGL